MSDFGSLNQSKRKQKRNVKLLSNTPYYQYGGHIELLGFKEYYGMPRGHEHDPMYSHQYLCAFPANFPLSFPRKRL